MQRNKTKSEKRKAKNICLLPTAIKKVERLAQESGFTYGQIMEMAVFLLSKDYVYNKAKTLGIMEDTEHERN